LLSSDAAAAELHGIHKRYGGNRVLRGVTLTLEAGVFHVLVGRRGAGKSTLLRILGRRIPPDAGTGFLLGRPIEADLIDHGRDVALVSEKVDYAVPVPLRAFFARFAEVRPGWDGTSFEVSLRSLGVDLDAPYATLSRSQRMQIACAAALAGNPRLLLLDEVTAVLDPRARAHFVDALAQVCQRGGTVLMASSIVADARDVADRVLVVEHGIVKADAPC
jgi:ABC-type multidrug transport system ATPase subunit